MLIRNVNSLFELENLKKQQASILQLQIDNEAIKERRVADFKNPNKPPPIPEQYKTASEIQADVMAQQKITIDHLKSLGLDNFLATQVAIDMSQLAEGDGAFFKFNSYFPAFKKKIDNNRILKTLVDSSQIIELIKIFFTEIDESTGLSIGKATSTDYFNNDTNMALELLPSKELMDEVSGRLQVGYETFSRDIIDLERIISDLISLTRLLSNMLPPIDVIQNIETLPNVEKTVINKNINQLLSKFNFPSARKLVLAMNIITNVKKGPAKAVGEDEDFGIGQQEYEQYEFQEEEGQEGKEELYRYLQFVAVISKLYKGYTDKTEKKLNEVLNLIEKEERATEEVKAGFDVENRDNQLKFITNQIKVANQNYLVQNVDYVSREEASLFPEDEGYDESTYFDNIYNLSVPTIDGEQPNNATDDTDNIIYENIKISKNKKIFTGTGKLRNGQDIDITEGEYLLRGYDQNTGQWEADLYQPDQDDEVDTNGYAVGNVASDLLFIRAPNREPEIRYTKAQLEQMILEHELPNLKLKLEKDPNYQPANVGESRIFSERDAEGYPVMRGNTQGWGVKPKQTKIKRKPKKSKKDSDSSSDEEKSVHIDINSHNGKNYKMSGDGFIKRRIKIGKGLAVRNDEPKFRQFGKYIIHMPQLRNNNILNLKHKSGGSIPSIKPVHIEDNFKEFIIDILDSGRVNDRHYQSLTEPEQNHFLKAVRGAGIIDDLKLKTKNNDIEKEEIKRLELLLGEVNAGNDNAGILKEARTLIKKYVSNGRISRQKGLDMLLELE